MALHLISDAQTTSSKIIIGGGIGYNLNSRENIVFFRGNTQIIDQQEINRFNFSPRIGFRISDNFAIGLLVSIYQNKSLKIQPNSFFKEITYTTSFSNFYLFGRYYQPLNEKFSLFGDFSFGPGFGKMIEKSLSIDNITVTRENSTNSCSGGIFPGISYFPHEKIGIELSFGLISYNQSKTEYTDPVSNIKYTFKDKSFSLGLNGGDKYSIGGINLSVLLYL